MGAIAAIAATALLASLTIFQAALIAGAPLGHFAWGGQHERLPTGLRIGSAIAILLYAGFATIMLEKAGVVALLPSGDWIATVTWVIVGYFGLGIAMNAISRSRPERLVMTPLVAVLFVLALIVALGL